MKAGAGSIKCLMIALVILMFSHRTAAQERVNLAVGFGIPEMLNAGVRFQIDQVQLGVGMGAIENMFSASGDFYYHFGGTSDLSDRRPWYARTGLNYLRDEQKDFIDKSFWISPRIGRDFNISEKFGVALDAGIAFRISHKEQRKNSEANYDPDFNFPILPALGLSLFYRL